MHISTPNYRPGWTSYLSHFTHYPVIIALDMGLATVAPVAGFDQYLTISIPMLKPLVNGFPNEKELGLFWEMERFIVQEVEGAADAIYAGRTTTQGKKHLIFFLYDPSKIAVAMAKVSRKYATYAIQSRVEVDPEWDIYFDLLYPNLAETNHLLNRRMVNRLVRQGDDLTQVRWVDHWVYFKTVEGRAAFMKTVEGQGFEVEALSTKSGEHHYPYLVRTSKQHPVDLKTVNIISATIRTWATTHGGDYDGWETAVSHPKK